MFFNRRSWYAHRMGSVAELVAKLTGAPSFVLCEGFRLDNLLFLNDSSCEDSLQEFAVVLLNPDTDTAPDHFVEGVQIESITISWCSPERLTEIIDSILAGNHVNMGKASFYVHGKDYCSFCA